MRPGRAGRSSGSSWLIRLITDRAIPISRPMRLMTARIAGRSPISQLRKRWSWLGRLEEPLPRPMNRTVSFRSPAEDTRPMSFTLTRQLATIAGQQRKRTTRQPPGRRSPTPRPCRRAGIRSTWRPGIITRRWEKVFQLQSKPMLRSPLIPRRPPLMPKGIP